MKNANCLECECAILDTCLLVVLILNSDLPSHCSYTDNGDVPHEVLFQTRNLMRTALSADQSKLVMSTSSGYIMVVHDFDINTIADDLNGFKVMACISHLWFFETRVCAAVTLYLFGQMKMHVIAVACVIPGSWSRMISRTALCMTY